MKSFEVFCKKCKRGTFGKAIVSLLFIAIGIALIYYGFTRPCEVAPIIQNVNGQSIEVVQPAQLNRLVCL